jgi:hypothetical protein
VRHSYIQKDRTKGTIVGPLDDHELRVAYHEQQLAAWEAERRELVAAIAEAEAVQSLAPGDVECPIPFDIRPDERVFHVLADAGRVESGCAVEPDARHAFCLRVTRDLRWNLGARRGGPAYASAPEVVDHGTAWITDRRVVFAGSMHAREWSFDSITDIDHQTTAPVTMIQQRGRRAATGISYDAYTAGAFRLRLAIALAHAAATGDRLVESLRDELADHEHRRPLPPVARMRIAARSRAAH